MSKIKVSVCMAVYNGEKYLQQQLASILNQLEAGDEVIIINDKSPDSSLSIINSFADPRITVFTNPENLGVVHSFEKALNKSTGDIIFFSDQDDIWLPGKVQAVKECITESNCYAVVSNAIVINDIEKVVHDSYFEYRKSGPGVLKNFYRNSYLGCCMAIHSSIKPFILPFPKTIPMHDEWIGMVSDFLGEVKFIPEPLIAYRRHSFNQTPLSGDNLKKTISKRFTLLKIMLTELPSLWLKKSFSLTQT
jgi:glycosyltransferase involved in cell wall biosynthesis